MIKLACAHWQELCPPCPKCKSKKAVGVFREDGRLIAVCSHCAIAAELRWSDEVVERGPVDKPDASGT